MNKFHLLQFHALLQREILEHRNMFIMAPAILAGLILLFSVWAMTRMGQDTVSISIEYMALLFDGLSPLEMAPMFMIPAIPFIGIFYFCAIIYLMNSLYQDRQELSILFWQSMPVSNLNTVLSKLVTIGMVAPLFYIATMFALYVIALFWLAILGWSYDIEVAGLGYMFLAAVVSLIFVYLSIVTTALWLLPTIGWVVLFSAFAKRTPILWAIGVFILVGFLEEFIFGTQFLGNFVQSRSTPTQYLILDFQDVVERLINYDMLFGIMVGSILLAGAVYMRRFID
jgi:ABC-2 type transport system permease protein